MPCVCNIKQWPMQWSVIAIACWLGPSRRARYIPSFSSLASLFTGRHPPVADPPPRAGMERLGRVGDHVVKQDGAAEPSPASALEPVDLLIVGGRVICPASQIDAICDVAVKDGVIAAVGEDLGKRMAAATVHDATGQLVTPGLVDAHGHL